MRTYFQILFALIVFTASFISCNSKEDCDGIDCSTPPGPLYLELIDANTMENMFEAGIVDTNDVAVFNKDFEIQKFNYIKDSYLLELPEITFYTGPNIYQINIFEQSILSFKLDMSRVTEDCCTFYRFNDFQVTGYDYDFNEATLTAKIYISLNN
jgi:hypothetical protein